MSRLAPLRNFPFRGPIHLRRPGGLRSAKSPSQFRRRTIERKGQDSRNDAVSEAEPALAERCFVVPRQPDVKRALAQEASLAAACPEAAPPRSLRRSFQDPRHQRVPPG